MDVGLMCGTFKRLSARADPVGFAEQMGVFRTRHYAGMQCLFACTLSDSASMAGTETIALVVPKDMPEMDRIAVPPGGRRPEIWHSLC